MCLIYGDEQAWNGASDEDRRAVMTDYTTFTESIRSSGNMVAGDALQPTSTRYNGAGPRRRRRSRHGRPFRRDEGRSSVEVVPDVESSSVDPLTS